VIAIEMPAGELALRRAGPGDVASLVELQQSAYARNRVLLGVEPLPLLADYEAIMRDKEVWLAEREGALLGALILEIRPGDLLIWSIATHPDAQGGGLGGALLAAAERRAAQAGHRTVRLFTGSTLAHLVGWYGRHGYLIEREEHLSDRSITHMVKHLA
jgi:ribosomal protein S18 acetylase RimI-like enzyme